MLFDWDAACTGTFLQLVHRNLIVQACTTDRYNHPDQLACSVQRILSSFFPVKGRQADAELAKQSRHQARSQGKG